VECLLPMKSNSDFLNSLIDELPIALFCKDYSDESGKFVIWNKCAQELWGLKKENVIGKTDFDFFPQEQARYFQDVDRQTIESDQPIFVESENVDSPTLGTRIVRTWKTPIVVNQGKQKFLLGISMDITETKKTEKDLVLHQRKTIYAAKMSSLGEMASSISHEFNNPLAIILGKSEQIQHLLADGHELRPEKIMAAAQSIEKTCVRIANVISNLQNFVRDGSLDPVMQTNANVIAESVASLCKPRFLSSGVAFEVNLANTEALFKCRAPMIIQALVNLLNNSFEAVRLKEENWIRMTVINLEDRIVFEITDSGNGIRPEIQLKMWEPFFSTKIGAAGAGLGLTLTKSIVDEHQGQLIYDAKQPNTTFKMVIPKNQAASLRDY
jgi:two-component system cell cycle sensor histidine kinase/response regulator CckA